MRSCPVCCLGVLIIYGGLYSTHFNFVLWCHLEYRASYYYNSFEQELQTFGLLLLGQADVLSADKTMAATMFRMIAEQEEK
jgi:hypothetical protein